MTFDDLKDELFIKINSTLTAYYPHLNLVSQMMVENAIHGFVDHLEAVTDNLEDKLPLVVDKNFCNDDHVPQENGQCFGCINRLDWIEPVYNNNPRNRLESLQSLLPIVERNGHTNQIEEIKKDILEELKVLYG